MPLFLCLPSHPSVPYKENMLVICIMLVLLTPDVNSPEASDNLIYSKRAESCVHHKNNSSHQKQVNVYSWRRYKMCTADFGPSHWLRQPAESLAAVSLQTKTADKATECQQCFSIILSFLKTPPEIRISRKSYITLTVYNLPIHDKKLIDHICYCSQLLLCKESWMLKSTLLML